MLMIIELFRLLRPKQWTKNFFILAALVFSKHLFEMDYVRIVLLAFVAFCLVSGSVYILNDILDVEEDRRHPEKRNRPIASGKVKPLQALAFSLLLIVLVIALVISLPSQFRAILLIYFAINIAYSWKLKEIIILDVFVIAAGFMLRVLGGAYVISVPVSSWMILCTIFISLFLGLAKRRGEIIVMQSSSSGSGRKVLTEYNLEFIDQMITVVTSGTVISYALYTVSERTKEIFHTENLIYTTVFVIFGIFRYLYLMYKKNLGESPTYIVTTDLPMIINIALWMISCVAIIYKADILAYLRLSGIL